MKRQAYDGSVVVHFGHELSEGGVFLRRDAWLGNDGGGIESRIVAGGIVAGGGVGIGAKRVSNEGVHVEVWVGVWGCGLREE